MESNAPEKKQFNPIVLAINNYWPILPLKPSESIFLLLDKLSLLISPPPNLNRTKSESHGDNCNMGRKGNELSWIEEIPPSNPNRIESESYGNICSKNHRNISDGVGV